MPPVTRIRLLSNGDNLANAIHADVVAGTLPQISWVVTNRFIGHIENGADSVTGSF
jgi:phospholipase C